MVCVDEYRRRSASLADSLHHPAVRHLRETASADVGGRRQAEHAEPSETLDDVARNVGLPIDGRWIERVAEERPQLRHQRIESRPLIRRKHWVGHDPVGDEAANEQALRDALSLGTGKEQVLGVAYALIPRVR